MIDSIAILFIEILLIKSRFVLFINRIKDKRKKVYTDDDGYGFGPIKCRSDKNNSVMNEDNKQISYFIFILL